MQNSDIVRKTAIASAVVAGFVIIFVLLGKTAKVLLLLFLATLLAVCVEGIARRFKRHLRVPRILSVLLVWCFLLAAVVGMGWLVGPHLVPQFAELKTRLPESTERVRQFMSESELGRDLLSNVTDPEKLIPSGSQLISGVSTTASVLTGLFVVVAVGFFMSLDPDLYVKGALHLVPKNRRQSAGELVQSIGHALRWWLVGRAASMTAVGILTAIGLWIIGVPLALTLALIAGVFSFVPFIGPIASVVPAALVAVTQGPTMVLYVLGLYVLVQILEGNFITPLIQQQAVSLPPALLIAAQVVIGAIFGLLGVLAATPATVALVVTIQSLYVRKALGDPIPLLGEHGSSSSEDEDTTQKERANPQDEQFSSDTAT